MLTNKLNMELVQGHAVPKYGHEVVPLVVDKAVITERATEADLPVVDLLLQDPDSGKKYFICVTGRVVNGISAAIKGVNMRNHGTPEP